MSNTNGNVYKWLYISTDGVINGVDTSNKVTALGNSFSARDISVSEDGTIWALSNDADPDGGGAKIYWSSGNGSWTEIADKDPGGIDVSGGPGSSCIYLDSNSTLRSLQTSGTTVELYNAQYVVEASYGGGYIWAVFPASIGKMPALHFATYDGTTLGAWSEFNGEGGGSVEPLAISSNYQGNCYGINNMGTPYVYEKDGNSSYQPFTGTNLVNTAIQVTSKNWFYAMSIIGDQDGNDIYQWVDQEGGIMQLTGIKGIKIAATYYK